MKIVPYIIVYLALLVPTLFVALNKWSDMVDPPTLEIPHSFWLSGLGQCLWFGFVFALPAFPLFAFSFVMRRIKKRVKKDSHIVA
jgi:hypothetical protein